MSTLEFIKEVSIDENNNSTTINISDYTEDPAYTSISILVLSASFILNTDVYSLYLKSTQNAPIQHGSNNVCPFEIIVPESANKTYPSYPISFPNTPTLNLFLKNENDDDGNTVATGYFSLLIKIS
jgi:hypothetical protein